MNDCASWLGWSYRCVSIHLVLGVSTYGTSSIAWDWSLIWLLSLDFLWGHYNAAIIRSSHILMLAWGPWIGVPIVLTTLTSDGAHLDRLIDGHIIASPHILGLDIRCLGYGLSFISLVDMVNHVGVRQGSTRRLDISLVSGRSRSPRRVILTKSVVFGHVRPPIRVNHGGSSRYIASR